MATVIFYEKPGCINNTKQKALLKAAGHEVLAFNLLTESWTAERLHLFLAQLPVAEWFNRAAPAVKSGEVNPEILDADTALQMMIQTPLLIRRPLIQIGDRRVAGFDPVAIDTWIGLQPTSPNPLVLDQGLKQEDLETCPRSHEQSPCKVLP